MIENKDRQGNEILDFDLAKEVNRMCNSFFGCAGCAGCGFGDSFPCFLVDGDDDEILAIVKEWRKENPLEINKGQIEQMESIETSELDYYSELNRMCQNYMCKNCPLCDGKRTCVGREDDEGIIAMVKEWSELNPIITVENKVTQEQVDNLFDTSIKKIEVLFNKTLMMAVQLPNGFVITETSSAVDPKNFDSNIGMGICEKKIKDKIWELEGYVLHINKGV